MTTTRLKMPLITEAQAQKHITHNEALYMLDVFVNGVLKSVTTATPPATPTEGDAYFLPAGTTDIWAPYVGFIAHYVNGQWYFYETPSNIVLYIEDQASDMRYDGAEWLIVGGGGKTYIDIAGGNQTLTDQQATADIIQFGGTFGNALTMTIPAFEKVWFVVNNSDQNLTLTTGAGGTIFLESGFQTVVIGDGTGIQAGITILTNGAKFGGVIRPPIYTVASAPSAASNYGALVFVTDGDAGSPCLAVSDGGSWLRISLGASISAT